MQDSVPEDTHEIYQQAKVGFYPEYSSSSSTEAGLRESDPWIH